MGYRSREWVRYTLALRLPPHSQTWAPNACLVSAELLLRPGQALGVVSVSILLLAHGGRCPQGLVPEQGPRASSASRPPPCRDRKGVRSPGGYATALYIQLLAWRGDRPSRVGKGATRGGRSGKTLKRERQGGQHWGLR